MPAITNKQQMLTQAHAALKKKYPLDTDPAEESGRSVLEELIYAACREGTTREDADRAYTSVRKAFIDWNEVRVSTVQEVADVLRPLPQPGARAKRIIALLQAVFEERYSYDLGDIVKKGLKDTARKLRFYKEGVNDFAVAWVIQRTLGGHAVPLDGPTLRVLGRLGVVDPGEPDSLEGLRGSIEHVIPKARGPEFTELISIHAKQLCVDGTPHCAACPLKTDCPTGQDVLAKKPAEAKSRPKPR
ncbi:MAG: nth [Gemmataceae bacterium]|nr:nth [Gemmataceae bacterium]